MAKRSVAYIKPEEPSFLRKLKEDIGYKEGPTVRTKMETLPGGPEDLSDDESEEPQVIVLKNGDLTKEEADAEKQKVLEEAENKPADLNERIIFKSKRKVDDAEVEKSNKKTKKPKKNTPLKLSFEYDEDDNEDS